MGDAKHIEDSEPSLRRDPLFPRAAKSPRKPSRHSFSIVRADLTEKQRRLRTRDKADLARLIDKLVAKRIRTCRLDRGLTQQSLADEVGVASQQIHKYESGISRISAGRLLQIAEALDLSVDEFFDFQRSAGRHKAGTAEK